VRLAGRDGAQRDVRGVGVLVDPDGLEAEAHLDAAVHALPERRLDVAAEHRLGGAGLVGEAGAGPARAVGVELERDAVGPVARADVVAHPQALRRDDTLREHADHVAGHPPRRLPLDDHRLPAGLLHADRGGHPRHPRADDQGPRTLCHVLPLRCRQSIDGGPPERRTGARSRHRIRGPVAFR
jgi:hypothetical protein